MFEIAVVSMGAGALVMSLVAIGIWLYDTLRERKRMQELNESLDLIRNTRR